jgi:hypothetical protein
VASTVVRNVAGHGDLGQTIEVRAAAKSSIADRALQVPMQALD